MFILLGERSLSVRSCVQPPNYFAMNGNKRKRSRDAMLCINVKENVQQVEVLHGAQRRLEPVEPDVLVAKTEPVQ